MAKPEFNSLLQRTLTGAFFVAAIVGGLFYGTLSSYAVLGIAMYFCVNEFLHLSADQTVSRRYIAIVKYGSMFIYTMSYLYIVDVISLSPLLWPMPFLLLIGISELYDKQSVALGRVSFAIMALVYVVLPFALAHVLLNRQGEFDAHLLLTIFILIWANDTFAYLFGVSLGKHRLWERISPKKSWEGFIGGGLTSIALSALIAHFFFPLLMVEMIGLAIIVVVFGTFGDLFESQLKRQNNIKDSGTALPGHGGFLDRFDSFLFIIPVALLYLEILN